MPQGSLISFVVIAYNEAANIARALAAISALDGLGEHEVIVVDDSSRDGTAQIVMEIAARNPHVRLIELAVNRGRGYARNRGVSEARGELIATVDADIVLPAGWLIQARRALRDHDAVGGTAVPDGDVAYLHRRLGLVPRVVGHTTAVTASNALYRRGVFDAVGFDPALREGEDVALNHAMGRQGLSAATVPGLLVLHQESKNWAASLRWLFDSGSGATRQLAGYGEIRQPDLAAGGFAAAVTLGLIATARGHRLLGTALPAGFVMAASILHVRSRFETSPAQWPRVASAVAVDSTLLTAYFLGRLAGLTRLRRRT
jgi:hypothetical protein